MVQTFFFGEILSLRLQIALGTGKRVIFSRRIVEPLNGIGWAAGVILG